MEQTRILVCEDSQEGIFTGIYEAYERRCDPLRTKLQAGEEGNLCLFADYIQVVPDPGKAEKVARTLRRRFGAECYEQICLALSSRQEDKGQAVYRTVAEGLSGRVKGELMAHLGNPFVARTFALARAAGNESHHLLGTGSVTYRQLSLFDDVNFGPEKDERTAGAEQSSALLCPGG